MSNPKTAWKDEDWERAKQLKRDGLSFDEIAAVLGVARVRVQMKFSNAGWRVRTGAEKTEYKTWRASTEAELDRERRYQAALRRTPTQQFFGDPPLGFSALDKRRPPC